MCAALVLAGVVPASVTPARDGLLRGLAGQEPLVLILSGGVRQGVATLGPAFAVPGVAIEFPEPGPYRLSGLGSLGEPLFSLSLAPDRFSDGAAGFTITIPFEPEWTLELDRLVLRTPQGSATLDRTDGGRAMLVRDRVTGDVRAILRDVPASAGLPPELAADSTRLQIIRGLPRIRN